MRHRPLLLVIAALLIAATPASVVLHLSGRPLDDDRYTILVMGSDMGPWRSGDVLGGRADAIHVVSVVPSQQSASILSFPRDSYIPVPGLGTTRINSSLRRGPETAVETVESLTGIEIDDWIVTGMKAFQGGVSAFGGVEIDVPQRLQHNDDLLEPGIARLDGVDALLFSRDRKNRSDGDFGRNRAQALVLATLHSELVARDPSPVELLEVIGHLRSYTVSSIPANRMPVLAATALSIDPEKVTRRQAPGSNATRGGAAVVVLGGSAEALYADLRDDGLFTVE